MQLDEILAHLAEGKSPVDLAPDVSIGGDYERSFVYRKGAYIIKQQTSSDALCHVPSEVREAMHANGVTLPKVHALVGPPEEGWTVQTYYPHSAYDLSVDEFYRRMCPLTTFYGDVKAANARLDADGRIVLIDWQPRDWPSPVECRMLRADPPST